MQEDLQKVTDKIVDIANQLMEVNDSLQTICEKYADKPAPKKESTLTLEDVRAVLAQKSRTGKTAEVRALLQKYGADKLSAVDPVNYKTLLADAEVL